MNLIPLIVLVLIVCVVFTFISNNTTSQSSLQDHILFSVNNTTHESQEVILFHQNGMGLHKCMRNNDTQSISKDTKWKLCKYRWNPLIKQLQIKRFDDDVWRRFYFKRTHHEDHTPRGYYAHTQTMTYYMYQPNHNIPKHLCKTLHSSILVFEPMESKPKPTPFIHALRIGDLSHGQLKQNHKSAWQTCTYTCQNTRHMHKWHVRLYIKPQNRFAYGLVIRLNTNTNEGVLEWKDRNKLMHVQRVRVRSHRVGN